MPTLARTQAGNVTKITRATKALGGAILKQVEQRMGRARVRDRQDNLCDLRGGTSCRDILQADFIDVRGSYARLALVMHRQLGQ